MLFVILAFELSATQPVSDERHSLSPQRLESIPSMPSKRHFQSLP